MLAAFWDGFWHHFGDHLGSEIGPKFDAKTGGHFRTKKVIFHSITPPDYAKTISVWGPGEGKGRGFSPSQELGYEIMQAPLHALRPGGLGGFC